MAKVANEALYTLRPLRLRPIEFKRKARRCIDNETGMPLFYLKNS